VGLLARASVGPAERLVNMAGEQRICAAAYAIAFLVNIAGCFVLAPRFGGEGAAAATAMAFVTESLLLAAIARRKLGLSLFILQKPARMRVFRSGYRRS
jgi:O-antigen/teichoic acid export membrane protein